MTDIIHEKISKVNLPIYFHLRNSKTKCDASIKVPTVMKLALQRERRNRFPNGSVWPPGPMEIDSFALHYITE